jgi:hypothetical protein
VLRVYGMCAAVSVPVGRDSAYGRIIRVRTETQGGSGETRGAPGVEQGAPPVGHLNRYTRARNNNRASRRQGSFNPWCPGEDIGPWDLSPEAPSTPKPTVPNRAEMLGNGPMTG